MNWIHRVKIRHLFTNKEDWDSVQKSMSAIADVIIKKNFFLGFMNDAQDFRFRNIPKGDEFFSPCDYANKLLDRLYDYADQNRIWIEL